MDLSSVGIASTPSICAVGTPFASRRAARPTSSSVFCLIQDSLIQSVLFDELEMFSAALLKKIRSPQHVVFYQSG